MDDGIRILLGAVVSISSIILFYIIFSHYSQLIKISKNKEQTKTDSSNEKLENAEKKYKQIEQNLENKYKEFNERTSNAQKQEPQEIKSEEVINIKEEKNISKTKKSNLIEIGIFTAMLLATIYFLIKDKK